MRTRNHERVIGKKTGLTSRVVQEILGVNEPAIGFLTDRMRSSDGATLSLRQTGLIPPRRRPCSAAARDGSQRGASRQRTRPYRATRPRRSHVLSNPLGRLGISLPKGEIILSGWLVPLIPAASGDIFELQLEGIGGASVKFID